MPNGTFLDPDTNKGRDKSRPYTGTGATKGNVISRFLLLNFGIRVNQRFLNRIMEFRSKINLFEISLPLKEE